MTWALKEAASLAGSFLESDARLPRRISLTDTFLYAVYFHDASRLYTNSLDVETDVVTWVALLELLVVHFDGLDFRSDVRGSEGHDHSSLDNASLDTADRYRANTTDFVHILEGKTEWLVHRPDRGLDSIDSFKKSLALDDATFGLLGPALEPGHAAQT